MKTPILISLLDHFFEINKLDLVMGYLTGKNDNRKEVKDFLKQLDEQDPMHVLLIALFQEQIPPILHCFFSNNNLDKLSMEKMRNVLSIKFDIVLLFLNPVYSFYQPYSLQIIYQI